MIDLLHNIILALYFAVIVLLFLSAYLQRYKYNRISKLLYSNCVLILSLLVIKGVLMIAETWH